MENSPHPPCRAPSPTQAREKAIISWAFSRSKNGRRWREATDEGSFRDKKYLFLPLLTRSYYRNISSCDGSGQEGTVSTASRNCRFHVQRLRGWGNYAPQSSGSQGQDPWILRSTRLRWLNNPSGKHQKPCDLGLCKHETGVKDAAFLNRASAQPPKHTTTSTCGLEATAGASPPSSFLQHQRAPP